MECSSAVTTAPVSCAQRTISSLSIGLSVWISTTRSLILLPRQLRDASMARATMTPQAITVASSPSISVIPLPIFGSYRSVKIFRHFVAAEPKIHGTLPRGDLRQQFPHGQRIRGNHDGHLRQTAKNREIGDRLVGWAVERIGKTAIRARELYVGSAEAEVRPHHLQSARGKEEREGVRDGNFAARCEPDRNVHQRRLAMPTLMKRSGNAASNI